MSDIEEKLKKSQEGGIVVGGERVWTIAYADDIVLLADEEEGFRRAVIKLEKYMDNKILVVNV